MGLPVPQLVLAEERARRGSYIVIDGERRLLALRQFAATDDDAEFDELRLRGLEVWDDLMGKTLAKLQDDFGYQDSLAVFDNQTIRTVVVRNWPSEDFVYLVFFRLSPEACLCLRRNSAELCIQGRSWTSLTIFATNSAAIRRALRLSKQTFVCAMSNCESGSLRSHNRSMMC